MYERSGRFFNEACSVIVTRLEGGISRSTRKGNAVADVGHTGDELYDAL